MTENCSEIEDVLKFESLDACKGSQKSPKFKFSVSGEKNVRLFGVMTKTSVLSDKNLPLTLWKNSLNKLVKTSDEFDTTYKTVIGRIFIYRRQSYTMRITIVYILSSISKSMDFYLDHRTQQLILKI